MLTKLTVRNFKGLDEAEIDLGNPVVFIGPNDSGKTSALQALALWDLGLRRWTEKRGPLSPEKRPGVVINRRDLTAVPVPSARQLWREMQVRRTYRDADGQRTENIRFDVTVEGVTDSTVWTCGLEFDFATQESFHCRPLRTTPDGGSRMSVPEEALRSKVVLLSPLSGLAANETKLESGAINVRLGEGRTAEVLRNICFQVLDLPDGEERWKTLTKRMNGLFGVRLDRPQLVVERGEIELAYHNLVGTQLDLSASGRGMQQTLLLLSFIALNPDSVVLLDEPDAHLEILRQRQTYELLSEAASDSETQIVLASHSEVVLNEAADRGTVVAFVGSPHRLNKPSEVVKALRDIGFEDYYQAEITGFALYLEGSTDLAILRSFAELLDHGAQELLERPFVHYVGDQPNNARKHFNGLREAKGDLVGFALFDRLDRTDLHPGGDLVEWMWPRREIENYLLPAVSLGRYAQKRGAAVYEGQLLATNESRRWDEAMDNALQDRVPPAALRDSDDAYWFDTKISDDLLAPVFTAFFQALGLRDGLPKANYHQLVRYLEPNEVHEDVIAVLDAIFDQQSRAKPVS